MTEDERPNVHNADAYNHALYHHIAHWAAYLGLLGLLLSFGFLITLSPPPNVGFNTFNFAVRFIGASAAIVGAAIGAYFFVTGMDRYGGLLHDNLPKYYLKLTLALPHRKMIRLSKAAAIVLAVWDVVLLILVSIS